jgi:hypothetical protein
VFAASRQLDISDPRQHTTTTITTITTITAIFNSYAISPSLLTHVASICLTWGKANMTFLLYPAISFV